MNRSRQAQPSNHEQFINVAKIIDVAKRRVNALATWRARNTRPSTFELGRHRRCLRAR